MRILRWVMIISASMLITTSKADIVEDEIAVTMANTIAYVHYCHEFTDEVTDAIKDALIDVDIDNIRYSTVFDAQLDTIDEVIKTQGINGTCVILSLVVEDLDSELFRVIGE